MQRKIDVLISAVVLSIAVLCVALPLIFMFQSVTQNLLTYNDAMPSISLEAFEAQDNYRKKPKSPLAGAIDYDNRFTEKHSLTVPVQFEINESGEVPNLLWPDQSGRYTPSIRTIYYEARLKSTANKLMAHLVGHQMSSYEQKPKKFEISAFDEFYVIELGIKKEVAFRKGKHVGLIKYYGNQSMATLIEAITEKYATAISE